MDYTVRISVCNRKTDRKYKNQEQTWSYVKERNKNPLRTSETAEEYAKLPKARRDELKDIGGFVGGWLKSGIRKNGNVIGRIIGLLDADSIPAGLDFLALVASALPDITYFIYSTHSHTPENQRYRIVILFSREVSEDKYPAIMRMIAKQIGMDYFDDTTYQANRMMYWASCPSNGDFVFKENDGEPLDPDKYLGMYEDWRDVTQWPTSSRQSEVLKREITKQKDPLGKPGVVGAFCRTYSIEDVLESELSDVYEATVVTGRYTFKKGESTGGLVTYDGKFAYSHHATDPACGKLCNAFDLVAIHKFGDLDDNARFKAMSEYAVSLDEVKICLVEEKQAEASADFKVEPDIDWRTKLEYEKGGKVLTNSTWNLMLILSNDPDFANFAYNEFTSCVQVTGEVPWERPNSNCYWRDADTAQLKARLDVKYLAFSQRNHDVCFTKVADDRRYHPVRSMLDSLPAWDGVPRDDTLFIDYLGAADNPYVRAVTRKMLVGAVARVKQPGIKFDSIPVLNGAQGIGKSTLIAKLGGEWYTDSLSISDMKDKTAAEKIQGNWIIEISEMAGIRKTESETVKSFVSRTDDKYRPSYGHVVESHPRQCIIIGTTNNEDGFLHDITGNRRFWPVRVNGKGKYKPWDLSQSVVEQIWAEALVKYEEGEDLYLSGDVADTAFEEQRGAMESDEREGLVRKYLETPLPANWEDMQPFERRSYILDAAGKPVPEDTIKRDTVCNFEIWCECFGKHKEDLTPRDSYAIAAMMMRIEGWKKSGDRIERKPYGCQRTYVRA